MKQNFIWAISGLLTFLLLGGIAYDKGQWYFILLGIAAYIALIISVINLALCLLKLMRRKN